MLPGSSAWIWLAAGVSILAVTTWSIRKEIAAAWGVKSVIMAFRRFRKEPIQQVDLSYIKFFFYISVVLPAIAFVGMFLALLTLFSLAWIVSLFIPGFLEEFANALDRAWG